MFVTHPPQLRETARRLRQERDLTVDELAERLALPRTTVYAWVRDLPLRRKRTSVFAHSARARGSLVMQANYRRARDAAYTEARCSFALLAEEPGFRDLCAYTSPKAPNATGTAYPSVIPPSRHAVM
jgi:transposase-like protein